ncbi:hypothetical protein [Methanocella paludicola]|nr:hypothetical protein [Methanocella paludicola]
MGFLDRILGASGGRKPEEARTCERCKNYAGCKIRETGSGTTCENYDERA